MIQKLVPLLLFIILVIFLGIGLTLDPREVPSPLIDKPLPAFNLSKVSDAEQTFASTDLLGQVSLLNVWASWCVACRVEHPVLVKLSQSGQANIYGLNYKDKREDALRWLEYFKDPYRYSGFDDTGMTGIDLGVYGVPETFIVDKKGVIRYKHIGPITEEVFAEKIRPIIQQLEAATQ
jgi:cytochrome c biogenesis protein CcmG/thiol:disulfide interchange protein DsbE